MKIKSNKILHFFTLNNLIFFFLFIMGLVLIWAVAPRLYVETKFIVSICWKITFIPVILFLAVIARKNEAPFRLLFKLSILWLLFLYSGDILVHKCERKLAAKLYKSEREAEEIAQHIETFATRYGQYPENLDELKKLGCNVKIPSCAPKGHFYLRVGDEFFLTLYDPRVWFGGAIEYSSSTYRWLPPPD